MAAGLEQLHRAHEFAIDKHPEQAALALAQHLGPDVVVLAEAIGEDPALDMRQNTFNAGVIAADHVEAVKGHGIGELDEGRVYGSNIVVVVHMVQVHIGDDVDNGKQAQEGAVGLVGLGQQVFALAKARVGPIRIQPPADDDGGVQARFVKHGGEERSGGGFAVGAGNGNAGFQAHEFGQHFRAGDDGNAAFSGFRNFGVVVLDRRGLDQHLSAGHHVLRAVADIHIRAQAAQAPHHRGIGHVRTGNLITKVEQHFGNAAHARTANAHHVNILYFILHNCALWLYNCLRRPARALPSPDSPGGEMISPAPLNLKYLGKQRFNGVIPY